MGPSPRSIKHPTRAGQGQAARGRTVGSERAPRARTCADKSGAKMPPVEAAPDRVPALAHGAAVRWSRQELAQVSRQGALDAQIGQDPVLPEHVAHHRVLVRDDRQTVGQGLEEHATEALAERCEHEAVRGCVVLRHFMIRHRARYKAVRAKACSGRGGRSRRSSGPWRRAASGKAAAQAALLPPRPRSPCACARG